MKEKILGHKLIVVINPGEYWEGDRCFEFAFGAATAKLEESMAERFSAYDWTAVPGGDANGDLNLLWRGNNYLLPTEEEMEYASDANDNMWEDPDFWIDVTDLKDTDIPTASSEAAQ